MTTLFDTGIAPTPDVNDHYTKEYQRQVWGIAEAFEELRPGCKFELYNTTVTKWDHPEPPPTWDEVMDVYERQKAEYEALQYSRDRKEKYLEILGSVEDQLEMIWDAINSGETLSKEFSWWQKINNIKTEFPKN